MVANLKTDMDVLFHQMPNLSKADQAAKVSQNEARRRKEVALAEIREMERDERAGRLLPADQ
jgi:hypothetical protein